MIIKEVKGIFDGQKMIDDEGNVYPVPLNYASKSMLIDGDELLLKLEDNGEVVFKQLRLHTRRRVIADIIRSEETGNLVAKYQGKEYQILSATLSYFDVKDGDKITLSIPYEKESEWGTIEYVIT